MSLTGIWQNPTSTRKQNGHYQNSGGRKVPALYMCERYSYSTPGYNTYNFPISTYPETINTNYLGTYRYYVTGDLSKFTEGQETAPVNTLQCGVHFLNGAEMLRKFNIGSGTGEGETFPETFEGFKITASQYLSAGNPQNLSSSNRSKYSKNAVISFPPIVSSVADSQKYKFKLYDINTSKYVLCFPLQPPNDWRAANNEFLTGVSIIRSDILNEAYSFATDIALYDYDSVTWNTSVYGAYYPTNLEELTPLGALSAEFHATRRARYFTFTAPDNIHFFIKGNKDISNSGKNYVPGLFISGEYSYNIPMFNWDSYTPNSPIWFTSFRY